MRRNLMFIVTVLVSLSFITLAVQASSLPFSVDAEIGFLYDFDSDQILYSQQGDQPWIPASLVKIMTMYVALDAIDRGDRSLEDTVVVSERAWRMGGSQMFLEVGERVSIESLLYGIAVVSGNDASVAIAEALAGTEQSFVRWMNDKAQELGLALQFADVHGLSEDNRITARDFALLVSHYLNDHPEALAYHQERSYGYQPRSRTSPIVQNNRNGLLWRFDGADGLKTGFLTKAGYNLVATAKQDDRRLIAIILGAANERRREDEVTMLLNYGFRSFESVNLEELLPKREERVYKGRENSVIFAPQNPVITIPRGARQALTIEILSEPAIAPIEVGQRIGEMVVSYEETELGRTALVASAEVLRGNIFRVILDTFVLFFQQLITRP